LAKFYPFYVQFTITQLFFLAFPLFALASFTQILMVRRRDPAFRASFPVVLTATSLAISAIVIALDPGGYFTWFFD
jgi:hypothetical protein